MIQRDKIDNSKEVKDLLIQLEKEKNILVGKKSILKPKSLPSLTDDEIPFEIPVNWMWVRLNDISIIQEGPGIRKSQYSNEGVQFLTVTNILEGCVDLEKSEKYVSDEEYKLKYKHFTINKGDIVSSCSGATWGKTAIYDSDDLIILNTSTLRLRFFGDKGNNKYLYFLTKAGFFKKQLSVHSTGQQANFGNSHYSLIAIPLPPLPEQQRIVSILDEAFSSIEQAKENLQRNLQNAKELFQSEMNSIFTNKGEGWEEKKLEEVCEISSKLIDPKQEEFQNLIHIGAGNIVSEKGTLIDLKTAKEEELISGKFLFDESMVLYSKIRPYLIKIVRCDFEGLCSADIYPLVPFKNKMTKDFLYYLLYTKKFTDYAILGSQRAGMPKVNRTHLFDFKTLLPPIKQQIIITEKLDKLSAETKRLEAMYQQKLDALEELKKSILQKAFSGELS